MSNTLPNSEIKKRLSRLNNLEKMYAGQKKTIKKLKKENRVLKAENEALRNENKDLRKRVEKLELIVEELQKMLFKKTSKNEKSSDKNRDSKPQAQKVRTKDSYRRATPEEKEITDEKIYKIEGFCGNCGGLLEKIEEVIRYEEDMNMPLEDQYVLKKVTRKKIQKGYCVVCKKWTYGANISSQKSTLGAGIRSFVVYGITFLRMSYDQLKSFLETMVGLKISDGEIVNILKKTAINLTGEYEAMKGRIRDGPGVHYDETVRNVQTGGEKRYGWVMVEPEGIERVYMLGQSRGGGNAKYLKGESEAVGISDNYGAYKNLFPHHQLCWAHPIRKMRDLANSKKLNKLQIEQCKVSYNGLKKVHTDLLKMLDNGERRDIEKGELLAQFDEAIQKTENEPEKMSKIKESLQRDKHKYFTCLDFEGIPTTNNTAERVLRPLVIKRKLSFGSKTSDGARMMEVIYSIVFSLLAKSPKNFFDRYLALTR